MFPEEVEAVVGPPGGGGGGRRPTRRGHGRIGVAVVVARDPATAPSLQDLRDHAATRLARHKLPEDVVVVPRLPLTTVAKLDRAALAGIVADRSPT